MYYGTLVDEFALKKQCGLKVFESARELVKSGTIAPVTTIGNVTVFKVGPIHREHYVLRRLVEGEFLYNCDCKSDTCEHIVAIQISSLYSEDSTASDDPEIISDIEGAIDDLNNGIHTEPYCHEYECWMDEIHILERINDEVVCPSNVVLLLDRLYHESFYSTPYYPFCDRLSVFSMMIEAAFNTASEISLTYTLLGTESTTYWGLNYIQFVPPAVLRNIYGRVKNEDVERAALVEIATQCGMIDDYVKSDNYSVRAIMEAVSAAKPDSKEAHHYGWMLVEKIDSADIDQLIHILECAELYDISDDLSRYMFLTTLESSYFRAAVRHGTFSPKGLLKEGIESVEKTGNYTLDMISLLLDNGLEHVAEEIIIRYGTNPFLSFELLKSEQICDRLYDFGCDRAVAVIIYDIVRNVGSDQKLYYNLVHLIRRIQTDPVFNLTSPSVSDILSLCDWMRLR